MSDAAVVHDTLKTESKLEKLYSQGHFVVTGELGPPQHANGHDLTHHAQELKDCVDGFNLTDNQVITTNPYMLSVKVKDPSKVSKVEYYIDNILIGTATLPDVNGVYDWPWDTSKYHSTVKIVVYGTDGTTEEIIRNTTVQLLDENTSGDGRDIVPVLPKTGEESWWKRISEYKKIF